MVLFANYSNTWCKQKYDWNLFKLTKFTINHKYREENSCFIRARKNLTPQRASLQMSATLSSILGFQLNRPNRHTSYQYNLSEEIIEIAKKVTWEYNKQHYSSSMVFNRLFIEMQYMLGTHISEVDLFYL